MSSRCEVFTLARSIILNSRIEYSLSSFSKETQGVTKGHKDINVPANNISVAGGSQFIVLIVNGIYSVLAIETLKTDYRGSILFAVPLLGQFILGEYERKSDIANGLDLYQFWCNAFRLMLIVRVRLENP